MADASPILRPAGPARLWIVAGSDSGGGAGLQADVKTALQLGVHPETVVTAVTAQNSLGVRAFEAVSPGLLAAQFAALREDMPPAAVKSGMLATPAVMEAVAAEVASLPDAPYVCDPVFIATSGDALGEGDVVGTLRRTLLPLARVLTPNIPEAEALTGLRIRDTADMERAAGILREMGAHAVYMKGGHLPDGPDEWAVHDFATDGRHSFWLTTPRVAGTFHGTGCTLASALAAGLADGLPWAEAAVRAQAYVAMAVRDHFHPGAGAAFLGHGPWPAGARGLFPMAGAVPLRKMPVPFAPITDGPLGFYPIVDRAAWVARLLPLGVRTVQLRVKDLAGEALAREVADAAELARRHGARLFVNDHWELAIAHGAYGVHLGQEDVRDADLGRIRAAGLRLGLSTHSYEEAARAHALRPSYMALGPIFPTRTKAMPWAAQGFPRLAAWRQLFPCPIVAIGGLTLAHAAAARAHGADGVAVITDLSQAPYPEARAREWLVAMGQRPLP